MPDQYLLPRHAAEIDRLDIQHYAFGAVVGANYLAPVERPQRVLDVGCGSGQWGFDACEQFSEALVVGIDLVLGKPEKPPRYSFVKANVLEGLPFRRDQFDLVHQRYLWGGVPLKSWPSLVKDLVRVTRPGGWVELTEGPCSAERMGPATERMYGLTRELAAARGLDGRGVVIESLDRYLRQAGLESVERREDALPIGPWAGDIGSLMLTDFRAWFTRVGEALQARSVLTAEEARDLIKAAQEEAETGRMAWPAVIAMGRKPLLGARRASPSSADHRWRLREGDASVAPTGPPNASSVGARLASPSSGRSAPKPG
jgi:SAM-dependent methyltransferase